MSVQKPVKTSLPALPASAAPDMRMYLERVREELSRVQGVQNSTTTILRTYGADPTNPTNPLPVGPPGTPVLPCGAPVTPTAPTGFAVTAGFNFFMVEWDLPTYCGHSHTEVYGTKDDGAQGTEVLLGTTGGTIFSLAEPNTGVRRCFWAKHVNLVGVKGPYNGTEGTCDTTALDPGHLIEVLTGQITETQLYKDLGEKIELLPEFDAAITDLNTATGELHEITDELAIGVTHLEEVTATQATTIDGIKVASDNATAAIVAINTVSVSSTSANARQVAGLTASVGTAQADIVAINTVSATSTSASARQLAGLTVSYNNLNATVVSQGIAFTNADQALAQRVNGVEATANGAANAANDAGARVATVETARIGYCSKNGETTADGTKEACQANGGVWNLGLPWATAVKQVSVTYNGQTVALQQQFSAISTDTGGLKAQYSVKIDNNGLVSGFGLASEPVTGGGSLSSFGVRADRFWIAAPTDTRNPGSPPGRLPFIVTTTGQWIDGEYFPPGVYVQEAFINAATITTAKIKNLAVDTAKINDAAITTAKIGDLAVDTLKIAGNAVTAASFHETRRTELLTFSTEYSLNLFYVRLSTLIPYYYTVPGLPDGETAATIITASVVMYPVAGDTANRVLAVDLYVDDVPVSGAAMAVMGDTMTATFVGMVYLDNRSHKIGVLGRIPKKTTTLSKAMAETNTYVTIMSGKR